jgi:hypothetical protein
MNKRIEVTLLDGRVERVATDWDSLSQNEFLHIVTVLFQTVHGTMSPLVAKITLTEILLHQQIGYFNKLLAEHILPQITDEDSRLYFDSVVAETVALSDFIIKPVEIAGEDTRYEVQYRRTRLWDDIRTVHVDKKTTWVSPDDGLNNITFWEWVLLSQHYEHYVKLYAVNNFFEAEKSLDLLLATMWRPPTALRIAGQDMRDKREALVDRELQVPERAKKWKEQRSLELPEVYLIRQSLLFWFQGCRSIIIERYPDLFEPGEDALKLNYAELMVSVAKGPDTSIVAGLNIHNVLTDLNLKAKQSKRLIAKS